MTEGFTVCFLDPTGTDVLISLDTDDPDFCVKAMLATGPPELFDSNGELTVRVQSHDTTVPRAEWLDAVPATEELRSKNPRKAG